MCRETDKHGSDGRGKLETATSTLPKITGYRPSQEAKTVFKTHKAVCEGYAKLFQALSRAMGVESIYLTGRVRKEFAPDDLIPYKLNKLIFRSITAKLIAIAENS